MCLCCQSDQARICIACTAWIGRAARPYPLYIFVDVALALLRRRPTLDLQGTPFHYSSESVSPAQVKIADFGSARFCEKEDTIYTSIGTPSFMSPEMCAGEALA